MDKWYALTEKGYDRVEAGKLGTRSLLGKPLADQLLDTMFDLEEAEPEQPHSVLTLLEDVRTNLGWSYKTLEKALREALKKGLVEEVFDWDDRFPSWV